MISAAWVCLFLPLGAALAITLAGTGISRRAAGYLATAATFGSFVAALITYVEMISRDASERNEASTAWTWLSAGTFEAGLQIVADPLSVFMMLIVAGVGSLIVGYSIGYMDGDDEERRYFAYMALFVFSMLLLVQAGNLLLLLAGWGLVGLSSYLLIGFWHHRPSAVAAAKKAFVMNAFGDATMALALFMIVQQTGNLGFEAFDGMGGASSWVINLVALGLLGGAVAKSAQVPLHTWLADAMEGPTPVSALIHAATMVTAGVYLIVRTHPLFELAPTVQDVAAGLGALTLLLAGLIALVQTDIKRVIAYSTMSQIGYMFLGAGLGAYAASMFHLMTHAFFKALLFLAAGLIIHWLLGEQDINKMGGLAKVMPWTYGAMLVGGLALAGVPPFAGFFSKDSIIASTLQGPWWRSMIFFVVAMAGVFLTGLYTFRMIFLVFLGQPGEAVQARIEGRSAPAQHAHELAQHERGDEPTGTHAAGHDDHGEGPRSMLIPVGVLTVLSIVGGWLQFMDVWEGVGNWLDPVAEPLVHPTTTQEVLTTVISTALALAGIGFAYVMYAVQRQPEKPIPILEKKFYFDELYDVLFYRPAVWLARTLERWVDRPLVAGTTEGVGTATRNLGLRTRQLQTGLVRSYVLLLAAGLVALVLVFVAVR